VTWLAAVILTVLALPPLLARLAGGHPPTRITQLAALAPAAAVPASAAVIVAAITSGWLAVPLAIPAVILLGWQLPPRRRTGHQAAAGPAPDPGSAPGPVRLRVLTVNALGGAADPAAVLRIVQQHDVDVLAVQELTPQLVSRLAAAGLAHTLPFSHLDPRPGSPGTGLWARWPLTPLPSLPGLTSATPRARTGPPGGRAVTLTAVHPMAPTYGHAAIWQRDLTLIQQALTATAHRGRRLQRQPGSPAVPGSPGGDRPHRLRRFRPEPELARFYLASHPGDTGAPCHAPRSRAGSTHRNSAPDPGHPNTPNRSLRRVRRNRTHLETDELGSTTLVTTQRCLPIARSRVNPSFS
jgi:endonuclease/exonuclease/phosphatase (EEP) superfamily protein YafD